MGRVGREPVSADSEAGRGRLAASQSAATAYTTILNSRAGGNTWLLAPTDTICGLKVAEVRARVFLFRDGECNLVANRSR